MVISIFKCRYVLRAPHLFGIVTPWLLLLLLFFFKPFVGPELQALTHAVLQTVGVPNPRIPTMETGAGFDPMLRGTASERGEPIRLPFLRARDQNSDIAQFVYAITLDDKALGAHSALLDADKFKLENAYGILFVQIINGGNFYLNGQWVAGLTESTHEERWMWYQPFVVPLPSRLLNTDGRPNVLTVSQTTHEPYISIPRSYFGNRSELTRISNVTHFLGTILANAFITLCVIMGLFFIGAWIASKKKPLYVWAGGACILWAVMFTFFRLHYSVAELRGFWRWCVYLCQGGFISLMTVFVLSFIGRPLGKWLKLAFFSLASIPPIVYAVGGTGTERYLDLLWTPALFMLYVYAISRLMGYCWKTRSLPACLLLLNSVFFLVLIFHDYAVQSRLIDKVSNSGLEWGWSGLWFEHIYLAHLGMPFLLIIVGYILLVAHRDNMTRLEFIDSHTHMTMVQQENELTEKHNARELAAVFDATQAERERIYQDIHDGIGSQLIKAIYTLRNNRSSASAVVDTLQACLQDLRLVINADTELSGDVQTVVFAFCVEQERQFESSGLEISYHVGLESTVYADPKVNLNVLRVLQESFSNTLKHSDATSISIKLILSASQLTLTIADNGHGHRRSAHQRLQQHAAYGASGNMGISGLALRAAKIGAKYTINITESGTKVCLSIPRPDNISCGRIGDQANPAATLSVLTQKA